MANSSCFGQVLAVLTAALRRWPDALALLAHTARDPSTDRALECGLEAGAARGSWIAEWVPRQWHREDPLYGATAVRVCILSPVGAESDE